MSLAIVRTRARTGVNAPLVLVEVHLSNGLPSLSIVGLPEAAVRESKDRVRSAIINSQFEFPRKRITINLAPADLPKEGGRFDLPIALGILAASEQISNNALDDSEFVGELALTGELRKVNGVLPAAIASASDGKKLITPSSNGSEAALPKAAQVYAASNLLEVCSHLSGAKPLEAAQHKPHTCENDVALNLLDVQGQEHAKRALEIAAAGGHSLLFFGPPGTGKTMLASRLPGILPPLTEDEALEAAAINSISRQIDCTASWLTRSFRNPHHTASAASLVGGGSNPLPGEISLAHHGVLFLDELPEFERRVLEVLREPLESGEIVISRAKHHVNYPAKFQLVAAMNPCPCGYCGDTHRECRCTDEQIKRYRSKISGPLLDRIDMHVEVPSLPKGTLSNTIEQHNESSQQVRARVVKAREKQLKRCHLPNHSLSTQQINTWCSLSTENKILLDTAMEKLRLSARAYHRILKVSRTIADLEGNDTIQAHHLSEALSYRGFDRPISN